MRAHLLGRRCDARHRPALARHRRRVADHEHVRVPGPTVRPTMTRPAGSAGTPSHGRRRGEHARRPDDRAGDDPLAADDGPGSSQAVTRSPRRTSTPSRSSASRLCRELLHEGGRTRSPASIRTMRASRVDPAEVARQRMPGELGDGSRHLDAGWTAAHDREGEQPRRSSIGRDFRLLERKEDAPADLGRLVDLLEAGRERLPFVAAEIGMARPCGDHQIVVGARGRPRAPPPGRRHRRP